MESSARPAVESRTSSQDSVTAMDYINSQLQLESEAREMMPYSFDSCTNPLGPLRQPVFSCKTCQSANNPGAPKFPETTSTGAAAICYSCSISCHGDHELVEIFNKRNVVCDCGTSKLPEDSKCTLRGVKGEKPAEGNRYCHNYWGKFCSCDTDYDPDSEKGTMYQCMLGDACREDWFHDSCIVGEKREKSEDNPEQQLASTNGIKQSPENTSNQQASSTEPLSLQPGSNEGPAPATEEDYDEEDECPPGFPEEEEFDSFICWLCVEKNPWLKSYAGKPGFLPAVVKKDASLCISSESINSETASGVTIESCSKKRKAEKIDTQDSQQPKRLKTPDSTTTPSTPISQDQQSLAAPENKPCIRPTDSVPTATFSLFLTASFRPHLCHCTTCFPLLKPHPVLLEEEETYEPPLDTSSDDDNNSLHSGNSLFDRGERALGALDRVKAIEGVMAYNTLKEKVKGFLKPFAESGKAVGAEDVKAYFAALRGDLVVSRENGGGVQGGGDGRKDQKGY